MRRKKMRCTASKVLVVLTVFSLMAFGGYAFAGQEMGDGPHNREWGHHGPGWHHGDDGYPGYGYMMGRLSDEQIQKMDKQRETFFRSTEDLRQQIYQKRLALESEFAKKNPDAKSASNLQKQISELRARIDQKKIEYLLEMKKIDPNLGEGWMRPGMMGYGYGRGWMRPGMMGYGYGRGWMRPGVMGYGYGRGYRGNGPMGYGPFAGHPCWQ
jgi:zinc resistance-associated protein